MLRGLAISLVILRHAFPDLFGGAGIVGVVVFFALSGYLITGILRAELERRDRIDLRRFYLNRAYRLFPPLLFVLAGFILVTFTIDPLDDRANLARTIAVAITYTANFPFSGGSDGFSHLWTLAVEEQFYLLWPVCLIAATRLRRVGLAVLLAGAAGMVLIGLSLVAAPEPQAIYELPTSWATAMIIGAAAQVYRPRVESLLQGRESVAAGAGLVFVLAVAFLPEVKNYAATYVLLGPSVAVATVAMITKASTWVVLPHAALKPLFALGTISYACYLWNYPIAMWVGGSGASTVDRLLGAALTVIAATISWFAVERPVRSWRRRTTKAPGPRTPVDRLNPTGTAR